MHTVGTVEKKCSFCGDVFEVDEHSPNENKYCSQDCYHKDRRKRVNLECENCGEEFETYPAANRTTCSKECQHEYFREREKRCCDMCGDSFEVKPSEEKKFCGRSCASKAKRERIDLQCENCGGEFTVLRSESDQKFCSVECNWDSQRDDEIERFDECQHPDCEKELNQQRKYCSRDCASRSRNPDPIEVRECDVCGETFEVKEYKKNVTCSKSCSNKLSTDYIEKACKNCNSTIKTTESENKKFCDRNCWRQYQRSTTEWHTGLVKENPGKILPRVEKECKQCGTVFCPIGSNRRVRKTCSRECERAIYRKNMIGEENPNWGGGKNEYDCMVCGKTFESYPSEVSSLRSCGSEECKKRLRSRVSKSIHEDLDFKGENHPRWKGGSVNYYGKNWDEQRQKALERDNYECVICGRGETDLGVEPSVHHIKPIREYECLEEVNKLSNLVVLCATHHCKVEGWNLVPSNSDVELNRLEA